MLIESSPVQLSKLDLAIIAMGGHAKFLRWWNAIDDAEAKLRMAYDWKWRARPKQLPPLGDWATWSCRCGRGWGKTLTGAEWVRWRVEREGARRIALVAPTAADVRDVMVEGPSGILAISSPWNRPEYEPSKRRLTWPNGAIATTFSADEPRALRGPQHDSAWCDEAAHWKYLEDAWDNLQMGLRMGDPKCLVTSSPRPLKFLRDLEAEQDTVTTIGSTFENKTLPAKFLSRLLRNYEGTRLGRQELHAEILTDNPNALWKQETIDRYRVRGLPEDLLRVLISVDPAITSNPKKSDETGIIGVATAWCKCHDGTPEIHAFVFDDRSGVYKPEKWGEKTVQAYDEALADLVAAEVNQGGELVERNLRATRGGKNIPFKAIHASRGKQMRHEPVSNLYEQGKVHHVGRLSRLEDQCCQWDPTQGGTSPDRADALTIGITELMLGESTEVGTVEATVIG